MIINDKIYGKVKINEPVILELLKTPQVLRLKEMSNYGVPDKHFHRKGYNRYEHSVGTMLLLKRLGATLEEQVAGLLHDVSHLAFSHIADWVFSDGGEEELADSLLEKFVRKTELAEILKKFNFSVERISNKDLFSLLERKIPDLCADRVDYALKELKSSHKSKAVNYYLKNLANFNYEVVFIDKKAAFNFARDFLVYQTYLWGSYQSTMRYYLFSDVVRIALQKKIISQQDLFKDEKSILDKLEKAKDRRIKGTLSLLSKKRIPKIKSKSNKKLLKKFRHVDPKVLLNGKLVRVSKIYPKFKKMLIKHREINKKGFIV